MGTRLDTSLPLWEVWRVDGLADGSWAILVKAHHSLIDGANGSLGGGRTWDWLTVDLADLDHVASRVGCTINDVYLAALTGGLRVMLDDRASIDPAMRVRALVPVSMRRGAGDVRTGNIDAALFVELPESLTDWEAEAVELIAAGLSNAASADRMGLAGTSEESLVTGVSARWGWSRRRCEPPGARRPHAARAGRRLTRAFTRAVRVARHSSSIARAACTSGRRRRRGRGTGSCARGARSRPPPAVVPQLLDVVRLGLPGVLTMWNDAGLA